MITDITIGQYIPGNSYIHRLDPRTKILATIYYMIGLFALNDLKLYVGVAAITFFILAISKIPIGYIIKGLKPILIILIFTIVLHLLLTPGIPVVTLGPLTVTMEGIMQGSFMALRLIFLIVITSLLTLTTSPISLTDGLEKLLKPGQKFGLPAHELAMMMSIALRFIPTLLDETNKIMKAQMARGADFESGNILNRAKNMIPLLVPLFVGAFRRADELAMAMEARCYRGSIGRTRMKQLHYTISDYFSLTFMVLFMVAGIILRYYKF